MTRTAISPRLAIRIFCSTAANVGGVDGQDHGHRPASAPRRCRRRGSRCRCSIPTVVETGRWSVWYVAETGSTNADLLALARRQPDRTVLVAGHQTAGRGRLDRTWEAPPGVNLLTSILFRDVPDHPGDLTRCGRHRRRRRGCRGGGAAGPAEVAQRRAARRPQAGRDPRPAFTDRRSRRGHRAQRRVGAGRCGTARSRASNRWPSSPNCCARCGSQGADIHDRYRDAARHARSACPCRAPVR